jgi:hypothetical protein
MRQFTLPMNRRLLCISSVHEMPNKCIIVCRAASFIVVALNKFLLNLEHWSIRKLFNRISFGSYQCTINLTLRCCQIKLRQVLKTYQAKKRRLTRNMAKHCWSVVTHYISLTMEIKTISETLGICSEVTHCITSSLLVIVKTSFPVFIRIFWIMEENRLPRNSPKLLLWVGKGEM